MKTVHFTSYSKGRMEPTFYSNILLNSRKNIDYMYLGYLNSLGYIYLLIIDLDSVTNVVGKYDTDHVNSFMKCR